jgi:hypothetical protein
MRSRFSALPFHFGKLRAQRRNYLDEAARRATDDPVAKRRVATITTMHLLAETFMAVDLMTDKVGQLLEQGDVAGAQRELEAARRRLASAKELSDGLHGGARCRGVAVGALTLSGAAARPARCAARR